VSRGLYTENYPVDQIISVAPRVLAILVLAEGMHNIKYFFYKGLGDESLPMDEALMPDFETTDGKLNFIWIQQKLPPFFEKSKHLELPEDNILPFLDQRYLDDGSFGMIYKGTVAEGCLPRSVRAITPPLPRPSANRPSANTPQRNFLHENEQLKIMNLI